MNSTDNLYYISILGGDGSRSSNKVRELIASGQHDTFIEWFMEGLAHQITCQTGSDRPIGETMANRIRGDLRCLINQLTAEQPINLVHNS